MREMVLNHASVEARRASRDDIAGWLKGLAAGMIQLTAGKVAQRVLRTHTHPCQVSCQDGYSLDTAFRDLGKRGYRDEGLFFLRLTTKAPLLATVEQNVSDRFLGCEGWHPTHPQPVDGEPLVLCALTDWIAISFPSEPHWDDARLKIHFRELQPDGSVSETSETIDNLARTEHADAILDRRRLRSLDDIDLKRLWRDRRSLFPNLVFGPEVEDHLKTQAHLLSPIVGKLRDLDESARDWKKRLFRDPCGWRVVGVASAPVASRRFAPPPLRFGPADDAPLTPARGWLWPDGYVRPVGTLAG